jgi:tetratricopeptide (TPR) repeat protein
VKVTARTSSFSFKGQNVDIASVADKLNVRHVLEGSVRRSGNTVRITAQLVDVRDNAHLWSQTYDREFDDIFAIQDEIAAAVVKELKIKLLQEQPRATRTDPRAYTLFLQARFLTNRGNPEAYAAAIGLLRQASDLAPAYAPAWAELARAYWFQVYFGLPSPQERETLVNKAHNSYEMALASDPEYSLVYSRLGTVAGYRADFAAAVSYLERALALGPNDIDNIGNAGLLLVSLGRLDEAIAVSQYEVKWDPLNPLSYSNLCRAYFFAEQLDDAIASCRTAQTLSPEHYSRYWLLPGALLHKGDAEAALAVFGPGSPREIAGFVVALYELGRREEFEAAFKDLRENGTALHVAEVYTWIDNPDAAFAWLEKDLLNPSTNRIYHVLPWFKKLHDDPRWQPFLERAGVSEKQRAGIEFEVTLPE